MAVGDGDVDADNDIGDDDYDDYDDDDDDDDDSFTHFFNFVEFLDCSMPQIRYVRSVLVRFEKATMDDMGFGEPNQLPGLD